MHLSLLRCALPFALTLTVAGAASAVGAAVIESPQVIRFHGGGFDQAGGIALDADGNIYIPGSVSTPNTDITFAVVKLNSQGALVWRAAYGGAKGGSGGVASAVTVDATGNVYAAGSISDGAVFGQNHDVLVVKLSPAGVEQWAQRYDGPVNAFDQARHLAVDQSGSVYLSGDSAGSGNDWLTQRYGPDGTPQWTRRHSGAGFADDSAGGLALTPGGNVVVAGVTKNNGDAVTNDIELITYDPQGAIVWQQQWTVTTASHELVNGLAIGADGRMTVTGSSASSASPEFGIAFPITIRFEPTGALLQTIQAGGGAVDIDADGSNYVSGFFGTPNASATAKYGPAGNLVWSTPLTVASNESIVVTAMAVDSVGISIVGGTIVNNSTLNRDYLTIRYSATGQELWRHRFNGTGGGDDRVAGLAVDGANAALVTGTSWSNTLSSGGTADDLVTLKFPAGVTPGGTPPPQLAAPSQLTGSSPARTQIRLNWQDNSTAETGFRVERCKGVGCTNFAQVATLGANVTTFLDGGLVRNTSYTYRLRAFDAAGTSPYSNPATIKTRL